MAECLPLNSIRVKETQEVAMCCGGTLTALTSAYEHYLMLLAICSLHLVDYDACKCSSPSHQ